MADTHLTKADLPEIIQRYVNGESIQTIAPDARRSRQTIYNWIHGIGEKEYPDIVRQAMVTRMADADHDLSIASTQLDIARAEKECRYTRWDLERRWSAQFGLKQETKIDTSITIIIQQAEPLPHSDPFILQAEAQAVSCLDETQADNGTSRPTNNELAR